MPFTSHSLATVATFQGLDPSALALLQERLEPVVVPGGSVLVREGDEPDALYIVVAGRFSVEVAASAEPVAEIGNGATIGEIAFFAGGTRTATCRAIRDSVVLRLTRADFDEISRKSPAIWSNITATLAQRLAAETRKSAQLKGTPTPRARPRTITLVAAGPPRGFPDTLYALAGALADDRSLVVDAANVAELTGGKPAPEIAGALNALEERYKTILYIADAALTPWSELAVRQADEVLLVAPHGPSPLSASVPLNEVEAFSLALPHRPQHRLVLLHERAYGVQGTRHWLADRPVVMHHHAARNDANSLARVRRFVKGQARGFVACGGGAYCAAHIGLYKAFQEASETFDIFAGSSGGAAMAAAFCENLSADDISTRLHAMFVDGRAMQRYTLPRYGLLDHTHFDTHLRTLYGNAHIEDLWTPYFAVAFDLTDVSLKVLRSGPVWSAIRASAAIPGLLPPFIGEGGHMLVDGSVAANVPIDIMHQVKMGPNVVVTFNPPRSEGTEVDYATLPGRRDLLRRVLNPWSKTALPALPSAGSILLRTLMANRNHFERHLRPEDWLLMPPVPQGLGPLDWRRHREVAEIAYRYAKTEIARKNAAN